MFATAIAVRAVAASLLLCTLALPSVAQPAAAQMDARVVQGLLAHGADLAKPHRIDFFIVVPARRNAEDVSTDMTGLGYQIVTIQPPSSRTQWTVHAQKAIAPQLETIQAITRQLDALASQHGGYYDGWGTTAVR